MLFRSHLWADLMSRIRCRTGKTPKYAVISVEESERERERERESVAGIISITFVTKIILQCVFILQSVFNLYLNSLNE